MTPPLPRRSVSGITGELTRTQRPVPPQSRVQPTVPHVTGSIWHMDGLQPSWLMHTRGSPWRSGHSRDLGHGTKGSHVSLGAGTAMVVRTAPDAAATTAAATTRSRVGKRMAAMVGFGDEGRRAK